MLPKIIGCDEFPKSEHGKMLVDDIDRFINDQYRMNAKDVLLAFEKAATHSLFLDGKRVDPSTFGKFLSRASVGKVLTAYKESKQSIKARPSGYNYKQLPEAEVKKVTPQEAYDLILMIFKREGSMPMVSPYRKCYEYLLEKKVVKQIVTENKSRGRYSHMVGSVLESNPYRNVVEKYFQENL